MTVLIDKLEKELARNCRLNNWDLGFQAAIDIGTNGKHLYNREQAIALLTTSAPKRGRRRAS